MNEEEKQKLIATLSPEEQQEFLGYSPEQQDSLIQEFLASSGAPSAPAPVTDPEQLDQQALAHYDQWTQNDSLLNTAASALDPREIPERLGNVAGAVAGQARQVADNTSPELLSSGVPGLAVPALAYGIGKTELDKIKAQGLPEYAYNTARGFAGSVPFGAGPLLGYAMDRGKEKLGLGPKMTEEERALAMDMDMAASLAGPIAGAFRKTDSMAQGMARNSRLGVGGAREGGIIGSMAEADSSGTANFQRTYETLKNDKFYDQFQPGDPSLATPREVETAFGTKTEEPIRGYGRPVSQDMHVALQDRAKAAAEEVGSLVNQAEQRRRAMPDVSGDLSILQQNSGPLYEAAAQANGGIDITQMPVFGELDQRQKGLLRQLGPDEFLKQRLHVPESQRPFLDIMGEEKFYQLYPEYRPGTEQQMRAIGDQARAQNFLREFEATVQRANGDISMLQKAKQNYDGTIQYGRGPNSQALSPLEQQLNKLASDGLRVSIEQLGEKYGVGGITDANTRYGAYTDATRMLNNKRSRQQAGETGAIMGLPFSSAKVGGFRFKAPISQSFADKMGLGFANAMEDFQGATKLPIKVLDALNDSKSLMVLNSLVRQTGAIRPGLNFEDMPPQLQNEMYDLVKRNFSKWFEKPVEGYVSVGGDGRIKDPMELDYHKQQALDPSIPESRKAKVFSAINDRGMYFPTKDPVEAQDLESLGQQAATAPSLEMLSKALSGVDANTGAPNQTSLQMGPDTAEMLQTMQRHQQGIDVDRSGLN